MPAAVKSSFYPWNLFIFNKFVLSYLISLEKLTQNSVISSNLELALINVTRGQAFMEPYPLCQTNHFQSDHTQNKVSPILLLGRSEPLLHICIWSVPWTYILPHRHVKPS